MKNINIIVINLLLFISIFISGCASGHVKGDYGSSGSSSGVSAGPYYTGDAASSISLAVLRPTGTDLYENEHWLPAFIQGMLASELSKHSAMTVISRESADSGERGNANHLLAGMLRKTSRTDFLLQLTLTDITTGVQKASFSKEISAMELRDSSAISDAVLAILTQIGVELTDEGRESLKRINIEEREGAVALARGLTSENQIERLSYLYSAVSYDSSLSEAVSRLEDFNKSFEGTLGELIQNDVAARNFWNKMIEDFESFYTAHPPFELVFTPTPSKKGATNYTAGTVNLKFDVLFRESPELDGMRQVIRIIKSGLARTGMQETWGFGKWPYSSKLFSGFRNFSVVAELYNEQGVVVQEKTFETKGRLFAYRAAIYPDTSPKQEIVFTNVDINSFNIPMVRIVSINKIDIEQAGNDGFMQVIEVPKLPASYPRNLLVYLTRNPL